ncbi:transposase [bacterium]|nr:transposase [bacterium]
MPRKARQISESGILHIMMRGINKQPIFFQEEHYQYFFYLMRKAKEKCHMALYAYCLMPNHTHFLIRSFDENPGKFIHHIGTSYAQHYNKIFSRVGHLFQDRYKSEVVQNDEYFIAILRYIHYNPIKAGLCKQIEEYPWSSFNDYISSVGITDTEFAINLFGNQSALLNYHKEAPQENILDISLKEKPSDEEVITAINHMVGLTEFHKFDLPEQFNMIRLIKADTNATIDQLVRHLHISKHFVVKALKK